MSTTYQLYQYTPSLVPAIAAIIIFTLLAVLHTYRLTTTRTWSCIPFAIGGLFETVGYIGLGLGHSNPHSTPAYIMQSILTLVAPALFAATIYMTLGRLIRALHGEAQSLIRVTSLTKIFVTGDILSFFIQGGGGGTMATGDGSKVKLGENIILAGLFFQIVIFGGFLVAAVGFDVRMRRQLHIEPNLKWERMLRVLYAVSLLIMARNLVRVVEFIGGRQGPLLRVEWPTYVLDAVLMASTMVIFLVGYPTMIKPGQGDSEGRMELRAAKADV